MNKATWRQAINEGGEGYTPYTETERIYSRDKGDVLRDLARADSSLAHEAGTYDADRVEALRSELAAIQSTEQADLVARLVAAGWVDAETTTARRSEWNAAIQAVGKAKITQAMVAKIERDLGYAMADLKAAISHYGC